jgi:hypothetical protein
MNLDQLSDTELTLAARALSIHRVSMRRKIDRLRAGSPEHKACLDEIEVTQRLMDKLNVADLQRISAA